MEAISSAKTFVPLYSYLNVHCHRNLRSPLTKLNRIDHNKTLVLVHLTYQHVREVTVVTIKNMVFWLVMPYSLQKAQYFGGTYHLYLKD
jgi:hypothetical protein